MCKICDTAALRECGKREFKVVKINKRLLRKDLKQIDKLQKFLRNDQDTTFLTNPIEVFRDRVDKLVIKQEKFRLNYFIIILFTYIKDGVVIKGANLKNNNTTACGISNDELYTFDVRLAEKAIRKLKINYAYLACHAIFLNYFFDFLGDRKIEAAMQKKINKNYLEPYKIMAEL